MSAAMLALVTEAFGGEGGIAQYNRDLLAAFVRSGRLSALHVLPRRAARSQAPREERLFEQRPPPGRAAYALAALRIALRRRFAAVFCGHLNLAPLAALVARAARARLIVQTHGIEAWRRPLPAWRAAAETADLVLAVSRYTRARVLDWAAVVPERVLVLPNTVGEAFVPGPASPARRHGWGIGERQRVLLTVARLETGERYKGHERVMAALPRLLEQGIDAVYVIAGEGSDRPRLEALVRSTGAAARVRFVGRIDRAALVEAYRMADLFVMPSTGEGFGIAFLEAMACGTPALALDAAGARDALADGALGTLVGEEALVPAMARLLREPGPDRVRLAAGVRRRFGRPAFEERAHHVLDRVLGG